jgi:para-nitrobenzyl esterase
MSRATLMLIPLVLLSACGGGGASNTSSVPTTPAAPPGLVATSCGSYQGSLQGSTYAFLGIRYAAAPTGSRRWQAPQPATCPTTVQQSNTFGVKCPQLDTTTNAFVGDEDCLTLNVWAPTAAVGNNSARRPVFVFIHGGGNSLGSSSETLAGGVPTYRGDRLSGYANAVVVTVNYRIGPLGFLAHPSLDAETAQNTSGNYGILDLIAALRWVRDSIGNFGGDPARVMVFGQSAGGQNTCMLLASPLAAGLFHEAAILSGGCPSRTRAQIDVATQSLSSKSGCANASNVLGCLRGKTAEELLRADPPVVQVSGSQTPWQPHVDRYVLRDAPIATFNAGGQNRVPVMVITTADETSRDISPSLTESQMLAIVNSQFGALAPQVLAQYPLSQFGGSPWRAYTQITTDAKFVCPARVYSRALARTQQEPVFRSLFAEAIDSPNLINFGAFHGAEILFVFDNLDISGYQATPGELSLRNTIQSYFRDFATNKDPNSTSQITWTPYNATQDNYLTLEGGNVRMQAGLRTARCDFWEQVLPNL